MRLGQAFKAIGNFIGQECIYCPEPIKEGEWIRFFGGPYLAHVACIERIINGHD